MTDRISASELLLSVYSTVTSADHWTRAMDVMADHIGARAGALSIRNFGGTPWDLYSLSSVYMEMVLSGEAEYYINELSHHEVSDWDHMGRLPIGAIERDENMVATPDDLDQRPDYAFIRQKVGVRRRIGFPLNKNRGWFDGMAFGFDKDLARVPDQAIDRLRPFVVHLAKAVELARPFHILKQRYNAILSVLDRMSTGLVLVLETGAIVLTNREAQRILSLSDGLSLSRENTLRAGGTTRTAELHKHIHDMAMTTQGRGAALNRLMMLERPSGARPYLLEVVPLRDSTDELNVGLCGALVVIMDPENTADFDISTFAQLHELTPAEAQVCALLLNGNKAGDIAEIRNTRLSTAKTQIKAIYAKTGVGNRAALTRLLVKTLPPIT